MMSKAIESKHAKIVHAHPFRLADAKLQATAVSTKKVAAQLNVVQLKKKVRKSID